VIVDVFGSMSGDKIRPVNARSAKLIPEMRKANADNPFAEMFVRGD